MKAVKLYIDKGFLPINPDRKFWIACLLTLVEVSEETIVVTSTERIKAEVNNILKAEDLA